MSNKRIFKVFEGFKKEALEALQDKDKMNGLLKSVREKLLSLKDLDYKFSQFKDSLSTFIRMIRAVVKGEYKDMSVKSAVLIVAGLLYFLSPIDFIPDFIGGLGLVDDVTIILWVYNSLKDEILAFESWESQKAIVIDPKS